MDVVLLSEKHIAVICFIFLSDPWWHSYRERGGRIALTAIVPMLYIYTIKMMWRYSNTTCIYLIRNLKILFRDVLILIGSVSATDVFHGDRLGYNQPGCICVQYTSVNSGKFNHAHSLYNCYKHREWNNSVSNREFVNYFNKFNKKSCNFIEWTSSF